MARKKGILSGLFRPKKNKNPFMAIATPPKQSAIKRPSEPPVPSEPLLIKVAGSESAAFAIPQGEYEGRIYTYDGRPIGEVREGEVFRMNIVRGTVRMTSIYTGSEGFSSEENCCVTFGGFAVGYLSGRAYYVSKVVEEYGSISIAVRHDGTDPDGGWPLLKAMLPETDWFKNLLGISRVKENRHPGIEYAWLPDKLWKIKVRDDDYSLTVHLIPTPKGSSAKPHLDIQLNGVSCAEVTAAFGCYNTLLDLVDAGPFECTLSNRARFEDDIDYCLEIRVQEP